MIVVMPASNAVSLVPYYPDSFNSLMMLNIYKEETDNLSPFILANEFA
jgi:hypothetical protein